LDPAAKVLEALLAGREPDLDRLPLTSEQLFGFDEKRRIFRCDVCQKTMKGSIQFEAHMKSRRVDGGQFLTSPLGANFYPRGEVVPRGQFLQQSPSAF
jgi:hypothetical protein